MENKQIALIIDDTAYETNETKKYANRKVWVSPNAQEVRTFIPGTIISLNVKEGDLVQKGDVIMVFEAMKMNNLVRAPHAGKVESLLVKEGDKLPKGFLMLTIVEG